MWYGLHVGLTRQETLTVHFWELMDLINIELYMTGGDVELVGELDDEDIIPDLR